MAIALIAGSISKPSKDPAAFLVATRYIEALKEMLFAKDNY